ncbi:MAG TPA: glycosyltransferase family 39 protein, partial [Candidatus Polarisedimenticolia bacterium]|nr:glycosyltransferase family 39 protein [Candidatus Polarisedimenticolia bacterium]
ARLWGAWAGVLAAALAAFEPNLVANASLVTTDVGAALFIFLTLYFLWEYSRAPAWGKLLGAGASMGLALASKYSTVILLPIAAAVILASVLFCGGDFGLPIRRDRRATSSSPAATVALGRTIPFFLAILAIAAVILPGVYFFQGYSTWWDGLRRVLAHQEGGHKAFFLGEYSTEGWLLYFPVAFAIKTPVPTLLLIAATLSLARRGEKLSRREVVFLLLPVILLFLAAMQGRINIGVRHILPVYPLLFVLAGRLATLRVSPAWKKGLVLGGSAALTAISSLAVAPHQLAYFNELVGGPTAGPRYLSDSNIDWGQDLKGLKAYMDREGLPMIYLAYFGNSPPAALGIRSQYAPAFGQLDRPGIDVLPEGSAREVLAISVCALQSVHLQDKDLYAWLAGRRPVARIGYSIYVYDLTGDAAAHLGLARTYLRAGPRELAVPELEKVLKIDPSNSEALRLIASLRAAG